MSALAVSAVALAGCAPSPLYVQSRKFTGTIGEIPRDGTGEPVWGAIRTVPTPPPGAVVAPAPGIPVSPAFVPERPASVAYPLAVMIPAPADAPPVALPTQPEPRAKVSCRNLRSCKR